MPVAALLAIIEALTPAQWLALLGMIPTIITTGEDAWAAGKEAFSTLRQVVDAVNGRMETPGVSHSDAASQLRTEGFAVSGWTDQETNDWMNHASGG